MARNAGIVLVVLLLLCGLAAWQVPHVVRGLITDKVAAMLGRQVTVGKIGFNPFTLTLRVHDLSVAQPQSAAPLLSVDSVEASVAWSSVIWFAPVVDKLTVHKPRVALVRTGPADFNFSDVAAKLASPSDEPAVPPAEKALPRFSLNNMRLDGGVVTLDDRVTGRKQTIDEIALGVPFLSTFGYATRIDVQPRVHLRVNGSPFDLYGTARPFDEVPSSTLNVRFEGLDLEPWAGAWGPKLPVVLHSGRVDSDVQVVFEQPKAAPAQLRVVGDMALRDLDLRETGGAQLLKWDSLRFTGLEALPIAHRLSLREIALRQPEAWVSRGAAGELNWGRVAQKLAALGGAPAARAPVPAAAVNVPAATAGTPVAKASADGAAGTASVHAPATGGAPVANAAAGAAPAANVPAPTQPTQAWQIAVGALDLQHGAVHVHDEAAKLDASLTRLAFTTDPIQWPQPADRPLRFWLGGNLPAQGWMDVVGKTTLSPLRLDLDVRAEQLALAPYGAALQAAAGIKLTQGQVDLGALVSLAMNGNTPQLAVRNVKLDLRQLQASDPSVNPPVALSLGQLALTADRWAPGPGATAFTLRTSQLLGEGKIDAHGSFTSQPLALKAAIDAQALDAAVFAPYFQSSLNATLKTLALGARGDLDFTAAVPGKSAQRVSWRGAVGAGNLDLRDRETGDPFFSWKQFTSDTLSVSMDGTRVSADLGNLTLADFRGRVVLSPAGRLNVMDLVAEPGRAGGSITQDTQTPGRVVAPAAVAGAPAPEIALKSVTLSGGAVTFSDRFVRPNYTAELSDIAGSVSALASNRPDAARVSVAGKVYRTAPFSLSGSVQPFARFLALDLKAQAKGVDLPRFNTYAAKYMGYTIKRGKLSLDLQYTIKNKALRATNKVLLTQLTLGDKTNSPQATSLPVSLAISLLRDRHGNIDLNLPVSGSLDDPSFSIGGIVWQVVVNLLSKAVTSPFSLLASAFGSDEELSYVEFPAGSAKLDDAARGRIDTLSKALSDRPALKLDISGRADAGTDAAALRQDWVEAQIRAAKARDLSTRSKKVEAAQVTVSAAERPKYLEKAYDAADLKDKPRNLIGLAKSLPPDQMEALLRAAAPAGQQAVRQLADARAESVYEILQKTEGLSDRVFIVAPSVKADSDGGARVDFSLK
jgi:hypothetical protein